MHRCFIKGSFRQQRRQRRWPRLWRWKETYVAPLWPGYRFSLYFSYWLEGEKMRWFSLGWKREKGGERKRGQKKIEKSKQRGYICNEGRSRPFATLSSFPQPCKTYRWNKTALRRRRVWFRCDIILPPSSTTSFSYDFSSAFLNPCAPHPLLSMVRTPPLHHTNDGWICCRPESVDSRGGSERERRRREVDGGDPRRKLFLPRVLRGKHGNPVTREEVRYLKRPEIFRSSVIFTVSFHIRVSTTARAMVTNAIHRENTFAN